MAAVEYLFVHNENNFRKLVEFRPGFWLWSALLQPFYYFFLNAFVGRLPIIKRRPTLVPKGNLAKKRMHPFGLQWHELREKEMPLFAIVFYIIAHHPKISCNLYLGIWKDIQF